MPWCERFKKKRGKEERERREGKATNRRFFLELYSEKEWILHDVHMFFLETHACLI
jgi:hypothetical protein